MLSGATDLEKRPEPEDMREPMRWLIRGFPGPGVAVTELTPANVDELLPEADRIPVPAEPEPAGGNAQPELGLGTLPAPRALPVSRLSYSGLEAYRRCSYRFYLERALRLPRAESPAAPGDLPEGGLGALLRGSLVHELLERLDFERPAVASEAEVARARRVARRHREAGGDRRPARHGRALRRLGAVRAHRAGRNECARSCRSPSRCRRRGRADAACSSTAWWTCTPSSPTGCSWSTTRATPSTGRDPVELTAESYSTQRLVYALAGLRSGAERVEVAHCFLEQPERLAVAVYEAGEADRLEEELLGLARRGRGRALRAGRRAAPGAVRRLPREGRAVLLGRAAHPPQQLIPRSVRSRTYSGADRCATEGERGLMPLCFIEPQEAIRVVAESVGREARRQLLGEVVRAWVDEIPEDELLVHYAKAVEELDDDDLSILAAWHASLEVGQPIANKEFLLGAFTRSGQASA